MAKLFELLTENEQKKLSAIKYYGACIDTGIYIKEMTVEQLSNIAFILIETEHNGKVPECVLSAEAINILTKRAIERSLEIF